MNTKTTCAVARTVTGTTPAADFYHEAITVLKTAIEQRRKLHRIGKSRIMLSPQIISVFNMFDAYKYRWNLQGVARFLVKHEAEIRLIIPSSNPLLMQRFEALLTKTNLYTNL